MRKPFIGAGNSASLLCRVHTPCIRTALHRAVPVRYKFSARPDGGRSRDKSKPTLLGTTPARTRFAPSPTGYLHIGSLRTALYNFLLARATGGQFLLRLEDTDQSRLVPDAERRLYEDLKWAGLNWDEGPDLGGPYGPYKQSERLDLYLKHAESLIEVGRAYRCFCTPEDLDNMKARNIQDGTSLLYNGTCSHIRPDESARRAANSEPHCVRFNSGHSSPAVRDLVYGLYKKPNKEDDFIIIKRDGYPTYHFANVVDDHLMKITHVIRGAEWLVSTPRHVALYEALGWHTPEFAHVGLLVDRSGQKLSKRHGDIDITSWRDRGILPVALLNYVLLLGWSPGRGVAGQQEVMDVDEMIKKFHLKFTKGNITVNNKDEFIQKSHTARLVKGMDPDSFLRQFLPDVEGVILKIEEKRIQLLADTGTEFSPLGNGNIGPLVPLAQTQDGNTNALKEYLRNVLALEYKSYRNPFACLERNLYFMWQVPESTYFESLEKGMQDLDGLLYRDIQPEGAEQPEDTLQQPSELAAKLLDLLLRIEDTRWSRDHIDEQVTPFVKSIFPKPKASETSETSSSSHRPWGYHFMRWVLAGMRPGPALIPTLELLGKEETVRRVEVAMDVASRWEESRA